MGTIRASNNDSDVAAVCRKKTLAGSERMIRIRTGQRDVRGSVRTRMTRNSCALVDYAIACSSSIAWPLRLSVVPPFAIC